MSALAGLWHRSGRPGLRDRLAQMLAAQRAYGPDDAAMWAADNAGLGRNLMRTLPEDAFDRQPIAMAEARMRLVADVRLDNREELCALLGTPLAAELSDAAILAQAYERWGEDCVEKLLGDFAFVVWNGNDQSWFLARDPLGKRPLLYFLNAELFAVASMPQGLHALAEVPCEANEELLMQMIELLPRAESAEINSTAIFRGIRSVGQGECVRISRGGESIRQYWKPSPAPLLLARPEDYFEALREQMDWAVLRRLRGARGVASHLSGGMDSSSVTATAARILQAGARKLVAFTSVPQQDAEENEHDRFANENSHAAATAGLYTNIEHVLLTTEGRSPLDSLDRSFELYRQPVWNLCNLVWLEAIQDQAQARHLDVLLTGMLGNHTISFTGFDLLPELARTGRWRELGSTMAALHRRRGLRWASLVYRSVAPWVPRAILNAAVSASRQMPATEAAAKFSMLHPERRAARSKLAIAAPRSPTQSDSIAARLWALRRVDGAALRKGTLAGWRIDERDPTTDQRLVEFCLSVSNNQFLRDGLPSALARDGFSDRLPAMVRYETRKGHQATDWHIGLSRARPRLMEEIELLAASPAASSLLDLPRLRQFAENWPTGGWQTREVNLAYRYSMLRALSAGHFLRSVEALSRSRSLEPTS